MKLVRIPPGLLGEIVATEQTVSKLIIVCYYTQFRSLAVGNTTYVYMACRRRM